MIRLILALGLATFAFTPLSAVGANNGPGCTHVCSRALADSFPQIENWDSLVITLSRSACFGSCPDYRVELHGDGTVVFTGRRFVAQTGVYRAHVSRAIVRRLVAKFRTADYFALKAAYRARATDLPTYVTSIAFDDQRKQVIDYGGQMVDAPFALGELERSIDETADTARWI